MRILNALGLVVTSTDGDRGAVATEYALLAALIAVVIVAAVVFLGGSLVGLFDEVASSYPAGS